MKPKRQTIEAKFTIKLNSNKLEQLKLLSHKFRIERCGVLLGYKTGKDIYTITDYIEDNSTYGRTSYGVIRTIKGIWTQLNEYARDNPPSDYLGEWHTHPDNMLEPSATDKRSMYSILEDEKYDSPSNVLLLISSRENIKIWNFSVNNHYGICNLIVKE